MDPNPQKLQKTLTDCLEAAAAVLRRYFEKIRNHQVTAKGRDFDIQTIADTEAERAIVDRIQAAFPNHSILAEEAGELLKPDAPVRWVVDPLDGTLNYRHGLPYCAVSIAVEVGGTTQLAGVYNPFTEELFQAERGSGATLNGRPIRVSSINTLSEALIIMGLPYDRRDRIEHYMEQFTIFVLTSQSVYRLGSAALDLCHVATGQFGGYYEEYIRRWDWGAGQLIVEEAGGMVTDYHGGSELEGKRQVCASNGRLHEEMLALLKPTVLGKTLAPEA